MADCVKRVWGQADGYRLEFESATHDTWCTQEGVWRTIGQLGHGVMVHCRKGDYINGHPDMMECCAHTVVKHDAVRLRLNILGKESIRLAAGPKPSNTSCVPPLLTAL